MKFSLILFGLAQMLKHLARKYPAFRERLRERDFTAQMLAHDEGTGRWYTFKNGKVRSGAGRHNSPDITLGFKNANLMVIWEMSDKNRFRKRLGPRIAAPPW